MGRTEVALIRSSNNEKPAPNTVKIKLTRFFCSSIIFEATVQRFLLTCFQYSIPNLNLQVNLLKEKREGILVYILSAITNDKKKNTYRAGLIYFCHAYFKHADWYSCQSLILWSFCCLPGNTTGLTQANRYQTSVPQPCNKPA